MSGNAVAVEFVVGEDEAGHRLDQVVATRAGLSRSAVSAAVEAGTVRVDGAPASRAVRLAAGQTVSAEIAAVVQELPGAECVDLDVRYEDADLAVISKPSGMPVHPGPGHPSGTLANALLGRWPGAGAVGEAGRPGIVHRLDAGTSGLMVVALSTEAYGGLVEAISERAVTREYRALVGGKFSAPSGRIEAPVGRDPRNRRRMAVTEAGKPAGTRYRVLATWENPAASLLAIELETGRTHQIRVHLASIGHPVAGDPAYSTGRIAARGKRRRSGGGDQSAALLRPAGLDRPFLHAARLAFLHPVTGERIEVVEPLPQDLTSVLDSMGEPSEAVPGWQQIADGGVEPE